CSGSRPFHAPCVVRGVRLSWSPQRKVQSAGRTFSCLPRGRPRSEKFPEQTAQPSRRADERARANRRARALTHSVPIAVQRETDTSGKGRTVDVIGQPAHANRTTAPDWQIENLFGNLGHAVEDGAAAGQHDSRVEALLVAGASDFVPDEVEDFFSP